MKLILSTDGYAKLAYHGSSTDEDILVPRVDEIRHSRTVFGPPSYGTRDSVHIELTVAQASVLIEALKQASEQ